MTITTQSLRGDDILAKLDALAGLRIGIFREFPYLYSGQVESELGYLARYAASPAALAILACDGPILAGAVTAIPLGDEMQDILAPFAGAPCPVERTFYIGELLFHPPYRGQGLGSALLAQVEDHVRALGGYEFLTCATVVRADDHPLRPEGYIPINGFLKRHHFALLPGVETTLSWPEVDGVTRENRMRFWLKPLA